MILLAISLSDAGAELLRGFGAGRGGGLGGIRREPVRAGSFFKYARSAAVIPRGNCGSNTSSAACRRSCGKQSGTKSLAKHSR